MWIRRTVLNRPRLGAVVVSGIAIASSHQAQSHLTSIQVLTDKLEPIDGAVIQIDSFGGSSVNVTNEEGQSPWVALDTSMGFDLILADKALSTGSALGLLEQEPQFYVEDPSVDILETTISRTQPVAVPILVDGLPDQVNNIYPPAGGYPHWRVVVPQGSSLLFSMSVAPLLDSDLIVEYLAYRGVSSTESYVRGVACVVPHVNLGTNGMIVGIRLLGDLEQGCVVDAYNIYKHSKTLVTGPPLQASVVLVTRDVAYVKLSGRLRAGHLALLLRAPGSAAQVVLQEDDPPQIVVPPNAGEGIEYARTCGPGDEEDTEAIAVAISSFFGDCIPPDPPVPSGWECEPLPPDPDENCPGPPAPGSKQCKVSKQRSPIFCRGAGSTLTIQRIKTSKWKLSFNVGGSSAIGGGTLSSGGGFEYGQDATNVMNDAWNPQGPNGQCIRYYIFNLVCVRDFETPTDKVVWSDGMPIVIPCGGTNTTTSSCSDAMFTESTCYR